MTQRPAELPTGAQPVEGIVHRRSPAPVAETVKRLTEAIEKAGAARFALVDHSGQAEKVGLSLRDTKLLIFGNPVVGTPVMVERPLAALDLPLKVLVWEDDAGGVWMSYLAAAWLASRYDLPPELSAPLQAADALTARVTG